MRPGSSSRSSASRSVRSASPCIRDAGSVERFFAWLGRNRRLAKDFEGTVASATAFLYAAHQTHCSFGLRFRVRWGDWGLSPVIRWLPLSHATAPPDRSAQSPAALA